MPVANTETKPARTTINLGEKTYAAAQKITKDLNYPSVSAVVRMSVGAIDAISTAEGLGYIIEMIAPDGTRSRYTLLRPLQIKHVGTGETFQLVETDDTPAGLVKKSASDNVVPLKKKVAKVGTTRAKGSGS
jgi:hypothetical protein